MTPDDLLLLALAGLWTALLGLALTVSRWVQERRDRPPRT